MKRQVVHIAGASGAWGDSPLAIGQLLQEDVHYLMMDYLAEVTMSLLAKAKMKDPQAGYPADFVGYLKPHLKSIADKGIKVVSNAGGVNPLACKAALELICQELNLELTVAVVLGDDLTAMTSALKAQRIQDMFAQTDFPSEVLTANAYLGAIPIQTALSLGADIVITGRCADSALALGILMHEFDWAVHDYDRLAAGSLVGHVLECGPQATGGVFTDWELVPDWYNIGYPIAKCFADGSFDLCKPLNTGGLISIGTVSEQILYEIENPQAYLLPDVTADFSAVKLEQLEHHVVHVSGAKGQAPTDSYKVSATYQDGHLATALVSISGVRAADKAHRTAQELVARAGMIFQQQGFEAFSQVHVEVLGAESSYPNDTSAHQTREVVLRLVLDHPNPKALALFAREMGSVGLSFAQGTTGLIGGRPKVTPVVKLFSFLIDKKSIPAITLQLGSSAPVWVEQVTPDLDMSASPTSLSTTTTQESAPMDAFVDLSEAVQWVPLIELAYARSGDKGNKSNIAIIARDPKWMALLRSFLTPARMAHHFEGVVIGPVVRYEAPGLHAFNFVLDHALGGGGMASPRIDPQGKAFGQRALEMMIPVPVSLNLKG